jgi:hypothetical protein
MTHTPSSHHAHFADLEQQIDIPPPAGLASTLPPPTAFPDALTPDLEKSPKTSPLLADDIYARFSPHKKTLITSIVSFSALLARPFSPPAFTAFCSQEKSSFRVFLVPPFHSATRKRSEYLSQHG